MKIEIGTHESKASLLTALKKDCHVSLWAESLIISKDFTLATKKQTLDLEIVSVKDFGFPDGATRKQIYDKALSLGYGICPAEVCPQLRLQYADQPMSEYLLVGMEPIMDSDGNPFVFYVVHFGDGRWLGSRSDGAGSVWDGDGRWLFVSRTVALSPSEPLHSSALESFELGELKIVYKGKTYALNEIK